MKAYRQRRCQTPCQGVKLSNTPKSVTHRHLRRHMHTEHYTREHNSTRAHTETQVHTHSHTDGVWIVLNVKEKKKQTAPGGTSNHNVLKCVRACFVCVCISCLLFLFLTFPLFVMIIRPSHKYFLPRFWSLTFNVFFHCLRIMWVMEEVKLILLLHSLQVTEDECHTKCPQCNTETGLTLVGSFYCSLSDVHQLQKTFSNRWKNQFWRTWPFFPGSITLLISMTLWMHSVFTGILNGMCTYQLRSV